MKFAKRFFASLFTGIILCAVTPANDPLLLFGRVLVCGIVLGLFFAILDAPTKEDFK